MCVVRSQRGGLVDGMNFALLKVNSGFSLSHSSFLSLPLSLSLSRITPDMIEILSTETSSLNSTNHKKMRCANILCGVYTSLSPFHMFCFKFYGFQCYFFDKEINFFMYFKVIELSILHLPSIMSSTYQLVPEWTNQRQWRIQWGGGGGGFQGVRSNSSHPLPAKLFHFQIIS